jgi:chitinase
MIRFLLVAILTISAAGWTCQPEAQNVLYWGQGGIKENADLAAYCDSAAGVDIIVLAFLNEFGNGQVFPSGTIGQQCTISSTGEPQNCDELATAIEKCKDNGVKVILSLGGAISGASLTSKEEAVQIGRNLWYAYGNAAADETVPRPFGATFVDGWDFNIEKRDSTGNRFYPNLIEELRSHFDADTNKYYITTAPQCPIPEPNVGELIRTTAFDYLWVQFYNNEACSRTGTINYDQWVSSLAGTKSAQAAIFLGVPASQTASTGDENGAQYYFEPAELAALVSAHKDSPVFGGVMMWSARYSDANVQSGCTYAQQVKAILTSGSPCSSA